MFFGVTVTFATTVRINVNDPHLCRVLQLQIEQKLIIYVSKYFVKL